MRITNKSRAVAIRDDQSACGSSSSSLSHTRSTISTSSNMVKRRFSNPLVSIKSFSSRCRSNRKGPQENTTVGNGNARKVSIDHTVFSRESSTRLNDSLHSRDLLPHDNHVESNSNNQCAPLTTTTEEAGVTPAATFPPPMRVSMSDSAPSHVNNFQAEVGQCYCETALAPARSIHQYYAPVPAAMTSRPAPASPTRSSSSVDPALQARIEAVQIQQQLLGENHPDVIFALTSLAKLHQRRGDYREASSIMRESQKRSFLAKTVPQSRPYHGQNGVPSEISFSESSS